MNVNFGKGKTEFSTGGYNRYKSYGTGVQIDLTGSEIATAILSYLNAHKVYIRGPRTITINGELCNCGEIYVDPSGNVVANGEGYSGRGHNF